MDLPKELKSEIADNIIRVVAPVGFFSMILCAIGILLLGEQQYYRLIPAILTAVLIAPSWLFAQKGKPLTGILFIVACLCIGAISGMVVSGGIHALSYTATLVVIIVFTVLYGKRSGITFLVFTVALGILFSILIEQDILPGVDEPSTSFLFLNYAVFLVIQFIFILIPVRLMFKSLRDNEQKSKELQKAVVERKQAQSELQSILNKSPDVIYRLDREGNIFFINDAIQKYGYAPENLTGEPLKRFVHPDDWPAAQQCITEGISGNKVINDIEVRLCVLNSESGATKEKTTDNKIWMPFIISSEGVYSDDTNSQKSFIGIQGIAHNISRVRHFAQQVDRLAVIVKQVAEDVIITDQEGVIQYVNPMFEKVTGYSLSEVMGKTPRIFKSGKQNKEFYSKLWDTIKKGESWKGQIWNKIKDGSLILQDVTITPIFDEEDKLNGYTSVRRDITRKTRIQDQQQQSQKMEAIGTMAGGIAHDFNNILAGMIGYTELALNSIEDNPPVENMLEQVIEAGGRATDLVRQILSFSRSQKSEVKPVNPVSITKEVLKLIRASLPSTIEIRQTLSAKGFIQADETKIHQILMNLFTNAGHAMGEKGGVLEIILEEEYIGLDNLALFNGITPGHYLRWSISDTGIGVPAHIMDKIFEPYFTTKGHGEGTGLGLSVVHGIVKEYGGNITVDSEVGKGTTFHILLPLIEIKAPLKPITATHIPEGNETILCIDDEKQIIDIAEAMLEKLGYRVTTRTSSIEALEAFRNNPKKFDLVITDMAMPNMTGAELSKSLLEIRPDIPIIISTGFSERLNEQSIKEMGIKALIMKPIVMRDIANVIREVLDKA